MAVVVVVEKEEEEDDGEATSDALTRSVDGCGF